MRNDTNNIWRRNVAELLNNPQYISNPRNMKIHEKLGASYKVSMPAFIDLEDRKVNYSFMFAEAVWILSGSNRLSDIKKYMKFYENFSDDKVFLRGAYGPKVVDQLGYIVDTLEKDNDSRQGVLNIWRERPGSSKDIPCTLSMQFLIRNNELNCITTMRSNDIIKGFTYDVFTFSMISYAVVLLLKSRGIEVSLGSLQVNAGSLHLYETDFEKAKEWIQSVAVEQTHSIAELVKDVMNVENYEQLIDNLWLTADKLKGK